MRRPGRAPTDQHRAGGPRAPGDWLLVFLGDARERIDAERVSEVNATLDLMLGAMQGQAPTARLPSNCLRA